MLLRNPPVLDPDRTTTIREPRDVPRSVESLRHLQTGVDGDAAILVQRHATQIAGDRLDPETDDHQIRRHPLAIAEHHRFDGGFPGQHRNLGAQAKADGGQPVLALMPLPGDVDVVLASELMEAGRAVQRGLVTPNRTTLVASTHRVYAIAEKIAGYPAISVSKLPESVQAEFKDARPDQLRPTYNTDHGDDIKNLWDQNVPGKKG